MNKSTIDKTKSIVIIIMAFLLLIAPCSFRNNVESTLDIAATKPLNPSKSVNTPITVCIDSENTIEKKGASLSQKQFQKKYPLVVADNFDHTAASKKPHYLQLKKETSWTPAYYILYKRLKIFDLTENNFA